MSKGFTLIEMLVSMLVAGILMTGVFSAFNTQQKSYAVQDTVVELQQNIRVGFDVIARDLRMAGFGSGATIHSAEIDAISFSYDQDNDGALNYFAYDLYESVALDRDVIGRSTSTSAAITLTGGPHYEATGHDPFVLDVEAIEFNYQLEDETWTTDPANPADIRNIQLSILARAPHPDPSYTNTDSYMTASGVVLGPYNDSMRRRFQIMTINCRNMGL